MKTSASASRAAAVEYVPCVLKLSKRKFACYVEIHVGRVPPLDPASNDVKIVSGRKKAWRAAIAMSRLQREGRSPPRS